ncbi:MAG TPA: hypothetical protein DD490_03170 [Acidobacteria bacterium]|nr:hypothetical protein [Acidobacteriota bacterium]
MDVRALLRVGSLVGALVAAGCGGAPEAAPPLDDPTASQELVARPGLIELRRWQEPRQRVVIDRAGVLLGPLGEPAVRQLFVEPDRREDLQAFLRMYAPFLSRSPFGELAFGGRGTAPAGPAARRMILEWVRKVAAEAGGVAGAGEVYGLVLAWHRGGGLGGCGDVAVYLDGEVRAGSCAGPESRGRLNPAAWTGLMQRYDRLRPFQEVLGKDDESGRAPENLTFAGHGAQTASPADVEALRALAAGLDRALAARRKEAAPVPVAPGDADGLSELDGEAAPAPEVPGPGLLAEPPPAPPLPLPQAALPEYVPPPPDSEVDEVAEPPGS